MTLILGVEDPSSQRAYLFGDRGIWRNPYGESILATPKIWRSGDWIFGGAGSWEMVQAASYVEMPAFGRAKLLGVDDSEKLMVCDLLGWLENVHKRCAELSSLLRAVDSDEKGNGLDFVAARGQYVFHLKAMAVVRVTRGWCTSGMWNYADGAMSALRAASRFSPNQDMTALRVGQLAMTAVSRVCDAVVGPFDWMCTDGTDGIFE